MSAMEPKPTDQSTPWPHENVKDAQGGLKSKPDAPGDLNEALKDTFPASDPPAMTQPKPAPTQPTDAKPGGAAKQNKGGDGI